MACAEPARPSVAHQDTHHEEREWEAQRQNFTLYYMKQNKTLKAAMQLMISNHNFAATHRQWERKIKEWNLQKYTSRQARIDEIQQQGRSIQEVAELGRRSGSHLQPKDDRNLRRFARRELSRSTSNSRSRSRSRSQSFGKHSGSTTPLPRVLRKTSAPEPVDRASLYGLPTAPADQLRSYFAPEATVMAEMGHGIDPSLTLLQDPPSPSPPMTVHTDDADEVSNLYLAVPSQNQPSSLDNGLADPSSYDYSVQEGSMSTTTTPFPEVDLTSLDMNSVQAMDDTWKTSDYNPQVDHFTESSVHNDHHTPIENLSPHMRPQSCGGSQPVQEFEAVPLVTYQPAASPHLGAAKDVADDPSIYNDCYASINHHTQQMQESIFQVCRGLGATDEVLTALRNELQNHRGRLVHDLTMHINSFASAKEQALGAMRSNLNLLRARMCQSQGLDERRSLTTETGAMSQQQRPSGGGFSLDSSTMATHAHTHRFSLPESSSRSMLYG